jgi:hypothetical protein
MTVRHRSPVQQADQSPVVLIGFVLSLVLLAVLLLVDTWTAATTVINWIVKGTSAA